MCVYIDAEFYFTKDEQVISESKMRQSVGPVVIIRALALTIVIRGSRVQVPFCTLVKFDPGCPLFHSGLHL